MKRLKQYISICIYLFLIVSSTFKSNAQETLQTYLKTASENNPGLKAKFSEYMAALEKVPQVGTLPDPQIAFGIFIQPVETRVGPQLARFSAVQMFPWFGTLGAKEDVSTEMAKAKYETFGEAKSKLFYNVKSTWYNLYFTKSAIRITIENIAILNTFRKLALIKIEAGMASAVDELRVEMEILDLDNQLKFLLDKLNVQKIAFNNLLNVEESSVIILPDLLATFEMNIDRKAILDSIMANNHQVLQLEFRQASFEYQQIVAKKMGIPNFSVGMDYIMVGNSSNLASGESGKDAIFLPKVGISIPLYRKKYTSMVKEAVFLHEAIQYKKDDKVNILESVYERAYIDYLDAERRMELHTKQLALAQKSLRILESEYATNGKNFEEILRMERQVLKHNLKLEKSRSDMNAFVAFINYLMGK